MNKFIINIAFLLVGLASFAQAPGLVGPKGGTTTVIDSKEIKLDTTERVYSPATQEATQKELENKDVEFEFNYNPMAPTVNLPSQIAMYRLKITQEDNSKSGFLKAGMGNYVSTLLDAYYGSRANDKFAWAVGVNHLGAVNGPVNKKESGYSENIIGLHGKYFLKNYLVSGNAEYRRNVVSNYGYAQALEQYDSLSDSGSFYTKSHKNPVHDISFNFGVQSINLSSPLKLKLNIDPRAFILNDTLSEFNLNTSLLSTYKIEQGKVKLDAKFQHNQLKSNQKYGRNFLHLRPSFEYMSEDKRMIADVGFTVDHSKDSTLEKSVSVYPFIKGSYLLIQDLGFSVLGELSGGLQQNNLKNSFRNNLWINQFVANTSNEKISLLLSLEATPVKNLTTKINFGYKSVENFNYYMNDSSDLSYYKNNYASELVEIVEAGLDVAYRFKGGHGVNLGLDYKKYTSKEELYYVPNLETNLEMFYKVLDNLKISSDISYISGLVGYNTVEGEKDDLSAIVDVNLKLDYDFNKKVGVFLYTNNLLNKKYNYYKYYPVQGINILGGLTVSF